MKLLKLLYTTILIAPLSLFSCGSDNNETPSYGLQGKWSAQYVFIETNMPSESDFDRTINGLYKQRFDLYSTVREFQEIAVGNDLGRMNISVTDKKTENLVTTQDEWYTIKGDSLTTTPEGGIATTMYYNVGENILITRRKIEKNYQKDEISPIMHELGIGTVIADDYPSYGTTGTITMEFHRIKE